MLIDETYIINDDYCDESSALACLLAKDVCFLNNADISYTYKKNYVLKFNITYSTAWNRFKKVKINNKKLLNY